MGGIMPSFFFPNKLVLLTASAEELLRPTEGPQRAPGRVMEWPSFEPYCRWRPTRPINRIPSRMAPDGQAPETARLLLRELAAKQNSTRLPKSA